jgi:putative transposase
VKYRFIKEHHKDYPVSLLCNMLEVKRAGYYKWQKGKTRGRRIAEMKLLSLIRKYHWESRGRYGLRRIHHCLLKSGFQVNKKTVYRIMRKYGIYSVTKRKFKVTTKHNGKGMYAENLLKGRFEAEGPNKIWTSDITYIRTSEGWLYLAVVLDIYTRRIVGWAISERITAKIVTDALAMAIKHQNPPEGLIFHSDRGSQYSSKTVRDLLKAQGFRQSMSSTGNCYDNAITESFFSTLKKELVYLGKFETRSEARTEIFEFIEIYYNRKRQHSSLGYLSPYEFEMKNLVRDKKEEIILINKQRVAYLGV